MSSQRVGYVAGRYKQRWNILYNQVYAIKQNVEAFVLNMEKSEFLFFECNLLTRPQKITLRH